MVLFADGCNKCQYEGQKYPSVCLLQPLPPVSGVNLVEEEKGEACEDAGGKILPRHGEREHASADATQQRRYPGFRATAGE